MTSADGPKHWATKLTVNDVVAIRRRHTNGDGQRELAREFKVDPRTVNRIVRGLSWKYDAIKQARGKE